MLGYKIINLNTGILVQLHKILIRREIYYTKEKLILQNILDLMKRDKMCEASKHVTFSKTLGKT